MKAILALLFCLIFIGFSGCGNRRYAQDDFGRKVLGKASWKVRLCQGKPDDVKIFKDSEIWEYKARTFDPGTGKEDYSVLLTVKDGKVIQIAY